VARDRAPIEGQQLHQEMTRAYQELCLAMGLDADAGREVMLQHWAAEEWGGISCLQLHHTLGALEAARDVRRLTLDAGLAEEQLAELERLLLARGSATWWFQIPLHKAERVVSKMQQFGPRDRARYITWLIEEMRGPRVDEPAANSPEDLGWGETPPRGQYPTTSCRDCGARIIWARTSKGKNMPVNALPSSNGNVRLTREDRVLAEVLPEPGLGLHVSHFVTCPSADKRRQR
jgi:hypothetical protein